MQCSPLTSNTFTFALNLTLPKFQDDRVRQALSLGMDRELMIVLLGEGAGRSLPVIPWDFIFDKEPTAESGLLGEWWTHDPTKAKQLLSAAGAENLVINSTYYQYGLELQSSGRMPVFLIGTSGGVQAASMGTALAVNQWSHLAIVFNGSTVQFYVNGAPVVTRNLAFAITARGNPLRIGADAGASQFYKGMLDDVRLYSRALTQAEIQSDMSTGV